MASTRRLKPFTLRIALQTTTVGWGIDAPAHGDWAILRLETGEPDAAVTPETLVVLEAPPEALGIPRTLEAARRGAGKKFQLPAYVAAALRDALPAHALLWLKLENPVGYLPIVPWERVLAPLHVPVVRVGAKTLPLLEPRGALDAALCFSCPASNASRSAANAIVERYFELLPRSDADVRVHIFADVQIRAALARQLDRFPPNFKVDLYEPKSDTAYLPRAASRSVARHVPAENPWLTWMREELQPYCVDFVHFICEGHLGEQYGALAFAAPISGDDHRWAQHVNARELDAFLTSIGAWSFGISSLPQNHMIRGLRYLTHELAALRSGPLLLHDMRRTLRGSLGDAYQYFTRDSAVYRGGPALSLYWHPNRARKTIAREMRQATLAGLSLLDASPVMMRVQRALEASLASVSSAEPKVPGSVSDVMRDGRKEALRITSKLLREHSRGYAAEEKT